MRYKKEFYFQNKTRRLIYNRTICKNKKSSPNKILWDKMFHNLKNFSNDFMETREQISQTRENIF